MEKRSHLVTFFRNGDPHFRGFTTTVNQKYFATLEALQLWLNEKIDTTAGCRYLFRLADGKLVKEIEEIEAGQAYVASSVKKFIADCDYGQNKERFWYNRRPAEIAGFRTGEQVLIMESKYKKNEVEVLAPVVKKEKKLTRIPQPPPPLMNEGRRRRRSDPERHQSPETIELSKPTMPNGSGSMRKVVKQPRIVTIISNSNRNSWRRVLINPNSTQPFEGMLHDFTEMVILAHPPCQTMYTAEPPYSRISSFTQLFRDHADKNTFIVCGKEYAPLELQHIIQTPDSSERSTAAPTPQPTQPAAPPPPPEIRMHIKGKERIFYPPSNANMLNGQLGGGSKAVQLNWVYGFNVRKPRSLLVAPQGELVYFVGNLVVLHNQNNDKQRFYAEHRDNVTAIAIHASGETAASAEFPTEKRENRPEANGTNHRQLLRPMVRIWSVHDLMTFTTIQHSAFKSHQIVAIDFLPESVHDHELILLADDASPFGIYVFDWRAGQLLAHVETAHSHFGQSRFHVFNSPFDKLHEVEEDEDDDRIRVAVVTSGKHHLSLWRFVTTPSRTDEPYRLFHIKTVSMVTINTWRDRERNVGVDSSPSGSALSSLRGGKVTITAIECDFHSVIIGDSEGTITVWRLPGDEFDEDDAPKTTLRTAAAIPLDDENALSEGALISPNGKVLTQNGRSYAETMRKKTQRSRPEATHRHRMFQLRNAHEKPIISLCFFNDGTLISASTDNEVKAWDTISDYQLVKSRYLSSAYGSIVAAKAKNSNLIDGILYVITNNAYILEGSMQTKFSSVLHSHSNPVQCLAVHPREHTFVSCCAGERLVCKWSAISHRILWKTIVEKVVTCCTSHPGGMLIALGTMNGQLMLVNSEDGKQIAAYQISKNQLTLQSVNSRQGNKRQSEDNSDDDDMGSDSVFLGNSNGNSHVNGNGIGNGNGNKNGMGVIDDLATQCIYLSYSPNGFLLAIAIRSGLIHIVNAGDQPQAYRHLNVKDGVIRLQSAVRSLDWSADSCYLQIITEDSEQHFWYIPDMRSELASNCRDLKWSTLSSVMGYHTVDIWQELVDSGRASTIDLTSCARSVCKDLLCVGYSDGMIELVSPYKKLKNGQSRLLDSNKNDQLNDRDRRQTLRKKDENTSRIFVMNNAESFRRVEKNSVCSLEFLFDDSFLLSLQRNSNVILQWKLIPNYSD